MYPGANKMSEKAQDAVEKALIDAMKGVFGNDEQRIAHALRVTTYAKLLLREERGDPEIVIPAAILHDIGIHEAERKHESNAGPTRSRKALLLPAI